MKQSYFDLVNENDEPTGVRASFDDVVSKGLWHRGVHAIIYTPEHEIVVQRRGPSLKFNPGALEFSVGGGVDAGETPEQAIIREAREELGLVIQTKDLRFVGKLRSNKRLSGRIHRVFRYCYAVCLPQASLDVNLNKEETSAVFLVPEKDLRRAMRIHRLKRLGRISTPYVLWRHLLNSI